MRTNCYREPSMVAVQLKILSASGKAETPSSLLIINAINSFCNRLHALPLSVVAILMLV